MTELNLHQMMKLNRKKHIIKKWFSAHDKRYGGHALNLAAWKPNAKRKRILIYLLIIVLYLKNCLAMSSIKKYQFFILSYLFHCFLFPTELKIKFFIRSLTEFFIEIQKLQFIELCPCPAIMHPPFIPLAF